VGTKLSYTDLVPDQKIPITLQCGKTWNITLHEHNDVRGLIEVNVGGGTWKHPIM